MHNHSPINTWIRDTLRLTFVHPEVQPATHDSKAIIQLCSINGQHCSSRVSTICTVVYKNIGNKIHLGLVKRCHSKAVHSIRKKYLQYLEKKLQQISLLPMPFINSSPAWMLRSLSVNHTSHLWPSLRSLLKNFKQICSMASPTHLILVAFPL